MIAQEAQLQIGSLLFEGLDQIDLTGPFEVFSPTDSALSSIRSGTPLQLWRAEECTARSAPAAQQSIQELIRQRSEIVMRVAKGLKGH